MLNILRGWVDRYFGQEEAVLLCFLLIGSAVLMVTVGGMLAPAIAGLIIAFLLQGLVDRLKAWGAPHWLSVSFATFVLLTVLVISFVYLIPVLWQQTAKLMAEIPRMLSEGQHWLALLPDKYPNLVSEEQVAKIMALLGEELGSLGQVFLTASVSNLPVLAGVVVYLILVPILVFFFLKDREQIKSWAANFLPEQRPMLRQIWHEMNDQVANYVRGKVIEILLVGTVSYIAFIILDLKYALLLGLLVGLSVIIPYIGAAVVTIPVLVVGLFQWGVGTEFYWLCIVYGIIQTLDGNVLVPLLFSETVNLHPVAIIIAVLMFGGIWGFWGVFFAIPLATLVKAVLNAWPINSGESIESVESMNGQ